MKTLASIIILFSVSTLSGCAVSTYTSVDSTDQQISAPNISDYWLSNHRDEITEDTIQYIRKLHPKTADWFPRFKIHVSAMSDSDSVLSDGKALQNDLNIIFNNISSKLLPKQPDSQIWNIDVNVSFANKKQSGGTIAAELSYGLLCFIKSALLVCPLSVTNIAELDAKIYPPNNKMFKITSYGGSTLYMSTPYVEDATGLNNPSKGKALAAAIADFSNKIVKYVNTHYPNKSLKSDRRPEGPPAT